MILTKSPYRIAFAGGGTDIPEYSNVHEGEVINATIDLGCFCFIEISNQVKFSSIDLGIDESMETENPKLSLHRATYEKMMSLFNDGKKINLNLTTYSEVPAGSGVGASSSMVVSMVHCISKFLNVFLTSHEVAEIAFEIERIDCGLSGGKQDQYSAAFGGFNHIFFKKNNQVNVSPMQLSESDILKLESSMILYYTGKSRYSDKIINAQKKSLKRNNKNTIEALHSIKSLVKEMKYALNSCNLEQINSVFLRSWESKKKTSELISSDQLNQLIDKILLCGANSVKISGAGGGGFMVIMHDPFYRKKICDFLGTQEGQVFKLKFAKNGVISWKK